MRLRIALAMVTIMLLATAVASTPGSFRGVVVEGPEGERHQGWIFVKGKNGALRRVEVASAAIHYDESYPEAKKLRAPRFALKPGIEVRVTATQDKDGEWHATQVEIMEPDADTEMPSTPSALTETRTS